MNYMLALDQKRCTLPILQRNLPAPPTPKIVVIAAALDKTVETPTAIAELPAEVQ